MPRERLAVSEMIATSLREIAELVLVFGTLDLVVSGRIDPIRGLVVVFGACGWLFTLGVVLERIRRE